MIRAPYQNLFPKVFLNYCNMNSNNNNTTTTTTNNNNDNNNNK